MTKPAKKSITPVVLYPEHAKLQAVQPQSQKCGEFFNWLQAEKGVRMECGFEYECDEDGAKVWRDQHGEVVEDYCDPQTTYTLSSAQVRKYQRMRDEQDIHCKLIPKSGGTIQIPLHTSIHTLLAEFFEIDERKLEEEKRAMIEACRNIHGPHKQARKH